MSGALGALQQLRQGGVAVGVAGHAGRFGFSLRHVTAIVGSFRDLDDEGGALLHLVENLEQLFALVRGQSFEQFAAAHGHEEKHFPEDDPQTLDEIRHLRQVGRRAPAQSGVDLQRHLVRVRPFDGLHGLGVGAGHAAKGVVQLGRGKVEAQGHLIEAGVLQAFDQVLRERRRRRGDRPHAQAELFAAGNEFAQVRPFHRVAAAENEHRGAHSRHVFEQPFAFGRGQLFGMTVRLRRRAAVAADEITGLRCLPDDEEWGFVEIHCKRRTHKGK